MIRDAHLDDAQQIANIYNYYVLNTTVTFEEDPVSELTMRTRLGELLQKYPWLVYEREGAILGYAYASPWKVRAAYRYSVEVSVYLQNGWSGKGIGTALYRELLLRLEHQKLHGVIGGMALPNEESVALHQKFGFEKVAQFKEVGFKFGKWLDVAYYEKLL